MAPGAASEAPKSGLVDREACNECARPRCRGPGGEDFGEHGGWWIFAGAERGGPRGLADRGAGGEEKGGARERGGFGGGGLGLLLDPAARRATAVRRANPDWYTGKRAASEWNAAKKYETTIDFGVTFGAFFCGIGTPGRDFGTKFCIVF